jgi:hypothetical protein
MAATPASENTLYFDAPIIHFQSPPPPMMEADSPAQLPSVEHSCPADEKEKQGIQVVPSDDSSTETAPTEASKDSDVRKDSVLISSSPTMGSSSPPILSRSMFTNVDGQRVDGSTFIRGAATTGPNSTAEPDDQLHRRAVSADASLTPKERSKIEKAEGTSQRLIP